MTEGKKAGKNIIVLTPAEYKKVGADMIISYSTFKSPFGTCLVASTDKGVCNILFGANVAADIADLQSRWPLSKIVKKHQPIHAEVEKYFQDLSLAAAKKDAKAKAKGKTKAHNKPSLTILMHLKGTDFQTKVWKVLLTIPSAKTSTYGDIAKKLGDAKLSRAVGGAIGANPIGYIIPCHRVLKSDGGISGFHWGIDKKKAMLAFEAEAK